jgi:hypothetical protein
MLASLPSSKVADVTPNGRLMQAGLAGRLKCLTPGFRPDAYTMPDTVCRIYYYANRHANSYFPTLPGSESYAEADIDAVVRRYYEDAKNGKIPEYPTAKQAVIDHLAKVVPAAKRYSIPTDFIRVVMYWLERAVDVGAARPDLLRPRSVDVTNPSDPVLNEWYRRREQQMAQAKPSAFAEVTNLLQTVMMVAVIGGAVYLLAPMFMRSGGAR